VNPLHASAEFALARALQRSATRRSEGAFPAIPALGQHQISSPIGLSYGEQGHYSTVTPIVEPEAGRREMIPVKLVARR